MKFNRRYKRILLIVTLALVLLFQPGSAIAARTTIAIDNTISDWAGVGTSASDPVGDVNGVGPNDLIRIWVTNDETNMYVRWDIDMTGKATSIKSSAYGLAIDKDLNGVADSFAWVAFDSQGVISASIENVTTGVTTTLSPSATYVTQINTGSAKTVTSVESKFPFVSLAIPATSSALLWAETHSSPVSTSVVKDRAPDGGNFNMNFTDGNWVPNGTGMVLDISKGTNRSNVPSGSQVTYTIQIRNTGSAAGAISSLVDTLPAGFTYVAGSSSGITSNNPTISTTAGTQTLTWILSPSIPAGSSVTQTFTAAASSTLGTYYNNATVMYSSLSLQTGDTAKVTVVANSTPVMSSNSNNTSQTIAEGSGLSAITATDADLDTLVYTKTSGTLPAGITLNSNGSFSGTASYTSAGSYPVVITVTDGNGGSTFTNLAITVTDVNSAPSYTGAAANTAQTIAEGSGLTALAAADPDGTTLTYTLTTGSLPAGINLNANGTFSGTASYDTAGSSPYSVTITASDGSLTAATNLVITVNNTNRAPSYTGAAANTAQTIAEGSGLTALAAADPDGTTLTYTLTTGSLPAGITLNANGTFSETASYDAAGSSPYSVTITASDGSLTAATNLAITVNNTNRAPEFTGAATNTAQTIAEGSGLTALAAADPDGTTLTYTLTAGSLPAGINLNANGTFSGTASYDAAGSSPYNVTITASDGSLTAATNLAITVNNTNREPEFTGAAANTVQTIAEGSGLTALAAADPDGTTLTYTLTAGSLPAGINLNANGTFSGTASYDAAGSSPYNVTITASDGSLTAATNLAITVNNTNREPEFTGAAANTAQTIAEGSGLTALAAADPDGTTLTYTLTAGSLPAGINLNANGTFSGTASYDAAGSSPYNVTITASDGSLTAATNLAITVNNTNREPEFTGAAANTAQTIAEGSGLTALAAADPDSDTLTYSLTSGTLPIGITFNADGTFTGATSPGSSGTFPLMFSVSDGTMTDTTTLNLTVSNTNHAPEFTGAATNTAQTIAEGSGLTALAAADPDGTTLTYTLTTGSLPAGITLNANGTFSGTASYDAAGSSPYSVTITASDGSLTAATNLVITVNNTNRAPSYTGAATNTAQTIAEGSGLTALAAADPDSDTLIYSVTSGSLPSGVTLNNNGTFSSSASYTAAGDYPIEITVSDGKGGTDTTSLTITVSDVDRDPIFTGDATNTAQTIAEGAAPAALAATDDADETLSYSLTSGSLPSGVTLNNNGTFSGSTSYTAAGDYPVVITVSDGKGGTDTTNLTITVSDVNRDPIFTAAATNTAQTIAEGAAPAALAATDDADETLSYSVTSGSLPSGVTLNNNGTFSGSPSYTAAGSYPVEITVSDSKGGSDTTNLTITVSDVNRDPIFTAALTNTAQTIAEGAAPAALAATDDADETLSYSVTSGSLPSGVTLNNNGTFSGSVSYTAAGDYPVVITVSDGKGGTDTTNLTITVSDVNRDPIFTAAATNTAQTIAEGAAPAALAATDDADETLSYSVTSGSLPSGVTLNSNGTFSGSASYTAAGDYPVVITVSDGKGGTDTTNLTITVSDVNRDPIFTGAATNTAQTIAEGAAPAALAATDDADETLSYSLTSGSLPSGLTLNANGSFSGSASYIAAGDYPVVITVSDGKGGSDTTNLTITVSDVNRDPIFTGAATNTTQTIAEGATPAALAATDDADETLSYSVTSGSLPSGLTLNANGSFSGSASYIAAGDYPVVITVSDGKGGSDTTNLTITVSDVNRDPIFTGAATNTTQTIAEGATPAALAATDDADETLSYSVTSGSLPSGLTLNANGSFSGTASYTAAGDYPVVITVSDGKGGSDTTNLTITVSDVNRDPVFTAALTNTAQTIAEGAAPAALAATDDADETLSYSVTSGSLPSGLTLNANGSFSGSTSYTAAGNYPIEITVSDGKGGTDTTNLTITVSDVNRDPIFTAAATNTTQTIAEGAAPAALAATDDADETLSYSVTSGSLPSGVTLNSNGTFSGSASYTAAGSYPVEITVSDSKGGTDTTNLTITVSDVNRDPIFTAALTNTAQTIAEGAAPAALAATDDADETLSYSVTSGSLPSGLTLNANGSFSGSTSYTAAGDYPVVITVSDGKGGTDTTNLTITVSDVNRDPAFTAAAINTAQTIAEGTAPAALAATDDADETLSYSVTSGSLPSGLTLNANGSFSGNASYTAAGDYPVVITVSDGKGGSDTTNLTITVSDVNRAPIFTSAVTNTAQTIAEGAAPAALIATDDADETLSYSVTSGSLPSGLTLNSNGSFSGSASYTAAGDYPVVITVSDGKGGTDSTNLTITVSDVNRDPIFTGAVTNTTQTIAEGGTPAAPAATDDADETLSYSVTSGSLPSGLTLNANGSFSGSASYTAAGDYPIEITVSDGKGGTDTTNLTITVSDVNRDPIFTAVATNTAQTIAEGTAPAALAATDDADETLSYSVTSGSLPSGLTLNANGSFSGSTSYTAAGDYPVVITVSDGKGGTDTTNLTITVSDVNRDPGFTAAAINTAQTIAEGTAPAALAATDDADETLSYSVTSGNLPSGLTLNTNGSFSGSASYTAAGDYPVVITVSDGKGGTDTTNLTITVSDVNRDPIFTGAVTNTTQTIAEGAAPAALAATDDADETLSNSVTSGSLPSGLTLNANGSFSGSTSYTAAGDYPIEITVSDGKGGTDTTNLTITVSDVNRDPIFTAAATNTAQTIAEGAAPAALAATDDADETFSYSVTSGSLPSGVTLNNNGTFSGTASYISSGSYPVVITVSDGKGGTDTTNLTITVSDVNRDPIFTGAVTNTAQTIAEGAAPAALAATDDADETLSYSVTSGSLPSGLTLNANGSFSGTASYTSSGSYPVEITVSDGKGGTDTTNLTITVSDVNRDPIFTAAATNTAQTIAEGTAPAALAATDDADETLSYSVTSGSLPSGLTLNANGSFSGSASYTAAGDYPVVITVSDGKGGSDTTNLTITVSDVNRDPIFTGAATNTAQTIAEGAAPAALTATDDADETLSYSVTSGSLPSGLTLNANGSFSGSTSYTAAGDYPVVITVSDGKGGTDTTNLTITVSDVNRDPIFTAALTNTAQTIAEGATPAALAATDDADETLSYSVTSGSLPSGLTLNANGSFSGSASYTAAGDYPVVITVSDGKGGSDTTNLTITVSDVNRAPVFTAAAGNTAQTIVEGAAPAALAATDDADETLSYSVTSGSLPSGLTLNTNGSFSGSASYTAAGDYPVGITVSDGKGGSDTTNLTITVSDVNRDPAFTAAATNTAQTIAEGAAPAALAATDDADETLSYSVTSGSLPSGVMLNNNGTFSGTASYTSSGSYPVEITVSDGKGGTDTTNLTITVSDVNRDPIFTAVATNTAQTIAEGTAPAALAASDDADETLSYSVTSGSLPSGLTLNANGSFSGSANYTAAGDYPVEITVSDTKGGSDTTNLTITVSDVNRDPIFTAALTNTAQTIAEGAAPAALAAIDDADETLSYSVTSGSLPSGVTLNNNGTFSGTASYISSGSYPVVITVSDGKGGTDTTNLTITVSDVNRDPIFTGAATNTAQTIVEGATPAALAATDDADETLSYSVTSGSLPSGLTLNANGSFSGTASYTAAGSYPVEITVSDSKGGSDTTNLTITVSDVNRDPIFTGAVTNTTQTIAEGAAPAALAAIDDADETLSYSVTSGSLPSGLTLNTNGSFSGSVSYTAAGDYPVVITVSDGKGGTDTTNLTITVSDVNRDPIFTGAVTNTAQTIAEGAAPAALAATDDADETLSYSVTSGSLPSGLTLNTNGSFSGSASYTAADDYPVVITVSDGKGGTDTTNLTITVSDVNRDPIFTGAATNSAQTIAEGSVLASLIATDPDSDSLDYSISSGLLPAGITLNSDGTFSGTVNYTSAGSYPVTVLIVDGKGGSISQSLIIHIDNTNTIPSIQTLTDRTDREGISIDLNITSTDIDGDILTYTAVNLPLGITIHPNTGKLEGTLTLPDVYQVRIIVRDGAGNEATSSFTWTVDPLLLDGWVEAGLWSDWTRVDYRSLWVEQAYAAGNPLKIAVLADPTITEVIAEIHQIDPLENLSSALGRFILTPVATDLYAGSSDFKLWNATVILPDDLLEGRYFITFEAKSGSYVVEDSQPATEITEPGQNNYFTVKNIFGLWGIISERSSGKLVNGASIRLFDLSGRLVETTTSDINGYYLFSNLKANQYSLVTEDARYSTSNMVVNVVSSDLTQTMIRQDIGLVKFSIRFSANPTTIVGDGVETTQLTAQLFDENGAVAPGIEINFSASAGSFVGPSMGITDADGKVSVTLRSSKIEGVMAVIIPITAVVDDPVRDLYGEARILMTFAPGALKGIVTDRDLNIPVAGAEVTVYKDFDNDGITDFSATFITGADGSYKIAIPRGDVVYDIQIKKPVHIGDSTVMMTFPQKGTSGAISGLGTEEFNSEITGAGVIVYKDTNGSTKVLTDYSDFSLKIEKIEVGGNLVASGLTGGIAPSTGVFQINNLAKGTDYKVEVMREISAGEFITVGYQDITVSQDGEINLGTLELIDPYGIITDSVTGNAIGNALVQLYYANTALNLGNGLIPDTLVTLPALASFPPANNANPQRSDSTGQYAFMVFPNTDYYILSSHPNYNSYKSPIISVGLVIVKHDFQMTAIPDEDIISVNADLYVTLTSNQMKYLEGEKINLTIEYGNLTAKSAENVLIIFTLPSYTTVENAGLGIVNGNLVTWELGTLTAKSQGSLEIELSVSEIPEQTTMVTAKTEIQSSTSLINKNNDQSSLDMLLLSNRFETGIHEQYIIGYGNRDFKPYRSITRAEIATIFSRIMHLNLVDVPGQYNDVIGSEWYSQAIHAVSKAGLMSGYPDGSFKPDQSITRAELISVISRFLKSGTYTGLQPDLTDISGHWAYNDIAEMYRIGIITGYEDKTFHPDLPINRAEAVTMINHLLFRGPLKVETPTFIDVLPSDWFYGEVEESAHTHEFKVQLGGAEELVRYLD